MHEKLTAAAALTACTNTVLHAPAPCPCPCHARGLPTPVGSGCFEDRMEKEIFLHDSPRVLHKLMTKRPWGQRPPPLPWLWQLSSTCGTCRGDIKACDADTAPPAAVSEDLTNFLRSRGQRRGGAAPSPREQHGGAPAQSHNREERGRGRAGSPRCPQPDGSSGEAAPQGGGMDQPRCRRALGVRWLPPPAAVGRGNQAAGRADGELPRGAPLGRQSHS